MHFTLPAIASHQQLGRGKKQSRLRGRHRAADGWQTSLKGASLLSAESAAIPQRFIIFLFFFLVVVVVVKITMQHMVTKGVDNLQIEGPANLCCFCL